jgi:hypothetical protein
MERPMASDSCIAKGLKTARAGGPERSGQDPQRFFERLRARRGPGRSRDAEGVQTVPDSWPSLVSPHEAPAVVDAYRISEGTTKSKYFRWNHEGGRRGFSPAESGFPSFNLLALSRSTLKSKQRRLCHGSRGLVQPLLLVVRVPPHSEPLAVYPAIRKHPRRATDLKVAHVLTRR